MCLLISLAAGPDGFPRCHVLNKALLWLLPSCRAWQGHPLAAAVYIPLIMGRVASGDDPHLNGSSLDTALVPLLKLHAAAEAGPGGCMAAREGRNCGCVRHQAWALSVLPAYIMWILKQVSSSHAT